MSDRDLAWTPEQEQAIELISAWANRQGDPVISLTGAAGVGKTSILAATRDLFPEEPTWTAMTGKAALRLRQVVRLNTSTLHKALYEKPDQKRNGGVEFTRIAKPPSEFVVIDEAGMLTPKMYHDLQNWVNDGVRILCVGDSYQLPPVMSGNEIKEYGDNFSVFREVDGAKLTKVMRSDDEIIKVVTMLREEGRIPRENTGMYRYVRSDSPAESAVTDYLSDTEDHMLITWRNQLRMSANREIRRRLGHEGALPTKGEPVMMCKNGQEVLNGEIHTVDSIRFGPDIGELETNRLMTVDGKPVLVSTDGGQELMDGGSPNIKDWKRYARERKSQQLPDPVPVTYGYVGTCHKCQGSEYRRVTVFLTSSDLRSENFRAETILPDGTPMPFATRWAYTALSRAKKQLTVILGK